MSTSLKRTLLIAAALAVAAEQAWLLAPHVQRRIFPPQEDQAAAGRRVAERLGCFACHGPDGSGGLRNPGSQDGVIPALGGGEMMMWADSEEQLREWVLYGRRLEDEEEPRSGYAAGQETERAFVMPAFESHLASGELDLLIAYLESISGLQFPEDPVTRRGFELAHELGCFRCHGAMGIGGVANPGSLKGYIPGFFGDDYAELVAGPAEAEQWIASGVSDRMRDNPLAAAVLARQAVKMPAYGKFLSEEQIDSLVALVTWLAEGHWRTMDVP